VTRLNYVGGRTNSPEAVRLLRTELFTVQNGARASVPHVAVLITDGDLDNSRQTVDQVVTSPSLTPIILCVTVFTIMYCDNMLNLLM